ncbi:MAG TPA: response regulator transcription factor [Thermoanaerobaculia bacterium]|nr:response regulator transcription factor [Thermoanaerobaculia bacterium]
MRLLIADDSPQMRRLLHALFGGIAEDIVECATGYDAVRCYFDIRPDWVLMDVRMDGLDGIGATREIVQRDPTAKIIVLSQYDDDEIREAAVQAGAVAYVHKENLLAIRKLLV